MSPGGRKSRKSHATLVPEDGSSPTFEICQQPIDELRRIAQQDRLVRQLLLERAQRLDERATPGQGRLDKGMRLLLADLLREQESRALGEDGGLGRVHVGLDRVQIDR